MISTQKRSIRLPHYSHERGFTLLEVMISIVVLGVGMLALLGAVGFAMANTQTSQLDLVAKQLAQQAMESIYTARDTANVSWCQLQNPGPVCPDPAVPPTGIFLTGFQQIKQSGSDGIIGTADDASALPQTLTSPGPDGILGTSDDVITNLKGFTRSVVFGTQDPGTGANLPPNLRVVTITIRYDTPQFKTQKNYVLTGYISSYR
jgi:prepilin-type N-terminal cleavage/methylation domain-containing protein